MKALIPHKKLKITVIQFNAGNDVADNLKRIEKIIFKAPASDVIALPEVFALRGSDKDYRVNAQTIKGQIVKWLKYIACARRSWVLAGSIIERAGHKIFNTSMLIDRRGKLAAKYRKIHLFEAKLETGEIVSEKDVYEAGSEPAMVGIEDWDCGLAICYDLRFPELFRHYSGQGAHLLFVPANFTQRTGKDHWEILLRARAIENQAFVVAPGQCGANPKTGIASYGNSMVVGPWGEILARAAEKECVLTVKLDPADLRRTRARIPVLSHRRMYL